MTRVARILLIALTFLMPRLLQAAPQFAALEALPVGGAIVLPLAPDMALPGQLNEQQSAAILAAADAGKFSGEKDTALKLYATAGFAQLLLVGLGDAHASAPALQGLGGRIADAIGRDAPDKVDVVWAHEVDVDHPTANIALGLELGSYRFDKYKTVEDSDAPGKAPRYVLHSKTYREDAEHWSSRGAAVVDGVLFARDLISEPANTIYPESFVDRTRAAFDGIEGVRIEALDVAAMERLKMGSILGVGMGSERPPRLLVVEYRGAGDQAPVVFVGKGVTFDSGGISLKNPDGMWKMKYDMSGAAAVTGALLTLAKRQATVNAVAIAALVENMPSQRAQRPGDVRTTGSGKTIEVINTDAEGRLILADAVWYAQDHYDPALLVDVATLTGSVRTALGSAYAGLFTRHNILAKQFKAAGRASGERVWRLPLHEQFRELIKSDVADIKNVSARGSGGGASVGAEVIGTFVAKETPWVHLDIAGTAWALEAQPMTPVGAAGWGVRLLNQVVQDAYEH